MTYELTQVLRGLALNRRPGWNFPGNFLDLSFDEVGGSGARLSLEPGPHCLDGEGQVDLGTLGVFADVGLAAGMRQKVGLATRMATVAMSLSLTGAARRGRLESVGVFDGFVAAAAGRQGLARSEIFAGGTLVATGSATFLALGSGEGSAPLPMRRRESVQVEPLLEGDLSDQERAVFERAQAAMRAGEGGSFIERFWGLLPRREEQGDVDAHCEFPNGLHVGNRVGHAQGGLTFALASCTAIAALGPEWQLAGASAWYLAPGTGLMLRAAANVVHRGGLTAVVRSRILDGQGRTVLEALTQHSRRAAVEG